MQVNPIRNSSTIVNAKEKNDSEFSENLINTANKLRESLQTNEGFLTCGLGRSDNEECIYLYVKNKETQGELQKLEESGFEGFKVFVRVTGQVEFA